MGKKIYIEIELEDDVDDEAIIDNIDDFITVRGKTRNITPAIESVLKSKCGIVADRANLREVSEYAAQFNGSEGVAVATVMHMTINTICRMLGQPAGVTQILRKYRGGADA